MGLDVYCDCDQTIDSLYHVGSSYHGFHYFRVTIAEAVGIVLGNMQKFGGTIEWTGEEPLYDLFDHSDCEGYLTPDKCRKVLEDLKKHETAIRDKLTEYDQDYFTQWLFILEHAVEENHTLVFR